MNRQSLRIRVRGGLHQVFHEFRDMRMVLTNHQPLNKSARQLEFVWLLLFIA